MTIDEINARMNEIRAEMDTDGADLDALEAEVRSLNTQKEELRQAAEEAEKRRQDIANGTVPVKVIETHKEETRMEEKTFAVDTVEYRDAYLKNLMGKELTAEERAALTSAAAVIPNEMQNKIWDQLRVNPLIAEIDFLHVPGYVTLPKATTVNDAAWVAMATAANDSADVVGSVTLYAKKLIKTIEITADIAKMSIPAFETWLVAKLVEKMEAAICKAVMIGNTGATVPEPQGVAASGSGATAVTKAFTLAGLSDAMGSLPAAYHARAIWVMSAATFYTTIVPLAADANGVLVMNGLEQRFLGHKVVLDDNAGAKIVFGDFHNGYAFNFGSDIEVAADNSVGFRAGSTVYRAMALCDGAVVQGEAFVVVTKAT